MCSLHSMQSARMSSRVAVQPFCFPSKQAAKMHACCKRAVMGTHSIDDAHVDTIAHRPGAHRLALCAYWRALTTVLKAFIQPGNMHACCKRAVMGTHSIDDAHVDTIAHRPGAHRLALCPYCRALTTVLKAFIQPGNMHACCKRAVMGTHNLDGAHVGAIAHRPGAPRLALCAFGELWLPFCFPSKQSAKMHLCCKRAVMGTHNLDGAHVGAIAHRPGAPRLALCACWRALPSILKAFIQPAKMHLCCKRAVMGTHNLDGAHVGAIAHRPGAPRLALCACWRALPTILKAFIQPANMHARCESCVTGTHNVHSAHVGTIAHRPGAPRLHHSVAVEARVTRRWRRPCASKASPVISLLLRSPCHRRMLSQVSACTACACTDSPAQCCARRNGCALVLGRVCMYSALPA